MSRLKRNELVTHVMSRELQTIHVKTPMSEVGRIFGNCDFHHLPVVDGSQLVGILSYTDLMRVSFSSPFSVTPDQKVYELLDNTTSVERVMTANPVTIGPNQSVREAAEILASGKFHALPVVDGENLVGMVTSVDLLKYLLEQY